MKNLERVILKNYINTLDEEILCKYGLTLEQQGWILVPMEGGYLSPDYSTIFITNRSPYHGQLIQYTANKEIEYNKIAHGFLAQGDFIKY